MLLLFNHTQKWHLLSVHSVDVLKISAIILSNDDAGVDDDDGEHGEDDGNDGDHGDGDDEDISTAHIKEHRPVRCWTCDS